MVGSELQRSLEQQDVSQSDASTILWQYRSGFLQYVAERQPFLYLCASRSWKESLAHLVRGWQVSLIRVMSQRWKDSLLEQIKHSSDDAATKRCQNNYVSYWLNYIRTDLRQIALVVCRPVVDWKFTTRGNSHDWKSMVWNMAGSFVSWQKSNRKTSILSFKK